jgi:tRNA threonylcarbamoyladenosine biosynthesis protein TsaB
MLILALDTTTRQGSAALIRDRQLIGVHLGDPERTHAERLPADLLALLESHSLQLADVDVYGVVAGPGSFTGLRVGIATIQGLAYASDRPIVPVSALEALAQIAAGWDPFGDGKREAAGTMVGVLMDAQRREVFSTLCRVAARDASPADGATIWGPMALDTLDPPAAEPPATVLARWGRVAPSQEIVVAGEGAIKYRAEVDGLLPGVVRLVEPVPPLAPIVGAIAAARAEAGQVVSPHGVKPVYVRAPDAELARDRRDAARRTDLPKAGRE